MKNKPRGPRVSYVVWICLIAIYQGGSWFAQEGVAWSASSEPDDVLLEFSESVGVLSEAASLPLLRVYHSGLVRVHVPPYMKGSGNYSMRLNARELEELIQLLHDKAVFEFDPAFVKGCKQEIDGQATHVAAAGENVPRLLYTSDPETIQLDIQIDPSRLSYNITPSINSSQCSIVWQGLRSDVLNYPSISQIQDLSAVISCLRSFCSHERLEQATNDSIWPDDE